MIESGSAGKVRVWKGGKKWRRRRGPLYVGMWLLEGVIRLCTLVGYVLVLESHK
jgi:hypothetical protein